MARNYAGILAARIFVGLPEVSAYIVALHMAMLILHRLPSIPELYIYSRDGTHERLDSRFIYGVC